MLDVRVLLLEDDSSLRESVAAVLRPRGVAVDEVGSIAAADERLRINEYDVVILDRMVPDGDAAEMLQELRQEGLAAPVIFLTAMADVRDRISGLDAGGDDYLVKPFAMEELLARIRSLSRRNTPGAARGLALGDLSIDESRMEITRGAKSLTLTPKEFSMLAYLVRHAGRVVSRSELLEHCWDEFADPTSNVVDVRMRLLRAKIGEPPLLHTVRGSGFIAENRE